MDHPLPAPPPPRAAAGSFTKAELMSLATTAELSLALARRREARGENLQGEPDLGSDCRVIAEVLRRSGYSMRAREGPPSPGTSLGWGAPEFVDLAHKVNRRHHTACTGAPGATDAIFDEVRPSFDASYTAYLRDKREAMRRMDNVGTSVASIPRECKNWQ